MADFRYFSPVRGHAVPRFGVKGQFLGAQRTEKGFEWNEEAVVALPVAELRRYLREYNRILKPSRGVPGLVERTEADYKRWQEKQRQQLDEEAAARKAARDELNKAEQAAAAEVEGNLAKPLKRKRSGDGDKAADSAGGEG